ncbi:MAG: hypothetical protein DRJ60_03440 [Thermoprotei archaeon]|nr:MAG: hypothetical protein DRJ60_03440 [Thermoprotei archaeon]
MPKMDLSALTMKRFREGIETIEDDFARTLFQLAYLMAARESELVTKVTRADMLKTKPYGNFLRWEITEWRSKYLDSSISKPQKVLLLSTAVAKRLKINKEALKKAVEEQDPEQIEQALRKFRFFDILAKWKKGEIQLDQKFIAQITGRTFHKVVGIPIDPKYEPWSLEILKWIRREGILRFDITDRQARYLAAKYLKKLFGEKFRFHDLKHLRITHLINYYNFDPYEITSYAGWSLKTTFMGLGVQVNPMLDIYAHLGWRKYFPKLLVPIDDFLS